MPYTCRMAGSEPILTPSKDQGYRVLGQREERDFTACSPANPDMCRRWKVYRFDVDCGGQRVPWVSLSAAADVREGGRSWVDKGSFHLQMPPRWSMHADNPCLKRARYGWRYGHLSRDCAERRATAADVVMPAGFAPLLGLDGIFVADGAPAAAASPASPPNARVAGNQTPAAAAPVELPIPKPARSAPPAPPNTKPAVVADAHPKTAAADAEKAAPPAAAQEPPQAVHSPSTTGTVVPTIINKPGQPSAAPPDNPPTPPSNTTGTPNATAALPAVVPQAPIAVPSTSEPNAAAAAPVLPVTTQSADPSFGAAITQWLSSVGNPAVLGVAGVAMLGLLALAFAYRIDQAQPTYTLGRDLASVSLEGSSGKALLPTGRWLSKGTPAARASASSAKWGDGIPQTRDDALQVLGIGVAPDINDAAVKKIIDGLRLSWHPDFAKNKLDREVRELRMKQINAAWEILRAARSA